MIVCLPHCSFLLICRNCVQITNTVVDNYSRFSDIWLIFGSKIVHFDLPFLTLMHTSPLTAFAGFSFFCYFIPRVFLASARCCCFSVLLRLRVYEHDPLAKVKLLERGYSVQVLRLCRDRMKHVLLPGYYCSAFH